MKLGGLLKAFNPLGGGSGGDGGQKVDSQTSTHQTVTVNPVTNVSVAPPVITVQSQDLSPVARAVEAIVSKDFAQFSAMEKAFYKISADKAGEAAALKETQSEFNAKFFLMIIGMFALIMMKR